MKQVSLKDNNLKISYRPLEFQAYGSKQILSFETGPFFGEDDVDCVIVDGPPFYTLRGREACLYQIYDKLRVGGLVILDDFRRSSEKKIVNNWLSVYPESFTLDVVPEGHHFAGLKKRRSVEPNWENPSRCRDAQLLNEAYFRIQCGLLHIDDDFLNSIQKDHSDAVDLIRRFNAFREAYQVTRRHIQAASAARINIGTKDRIRFQSKCYMTVVRKLYEDDYIPSYIS